MLQCNQIYLTRFVKLPKDSTYGRVGRLLQLCQVQGTLKWGTVCWLSWEALIDRYKHQERITLVIKKQEISFSTIDNIHSTPINAKAQVVLELVNPITLWALWKQHCRLLGLLQSNRAPCGVIAGDGVQS